MPGEQMWFRVSMHAVHVADMVVAVGQPGQLDGRTAIVVHGRASTAGVLELLTDVSEETTVSVDAATGVPIAREDVEAEGTTVRRYESTYRAGAVDFVARSAADDDGYAWNQPTPDGAVYDNYTLVGLLRGWRPPAGEVTDFYAVTDRILNLHVARFSGVEEVDVLDRPTQALRYDVDVLEATADQVGERLADQSYTMWFADDESRAPVRIAAPHRMGRLEYELTDYRSE